MFCEQAHEFGHPDFDNHNSTGMFGYSLQGWLTYGKTKLSNLYFTYELHRRMRLVGIDDVDVNAVVDVIQGRKGTVPGTVLGGFLLAGLQYIQARRNR